MAPTIALTGATGFIGSAIARRLSEHGLSVRALVRPASALSRLGKTPVELVTGSLEHEPSLRQLVSGVHAVIHCAGAIRGASRADFDRTNVAGLVRLVEAAAEQHATPRLLMLSSLAAREPGLSDYAASKREGERALAARAVRKPWTVLRPPAVYGPGDRELLPLFLSMRRGFAPVLGTRDGRFSLLYVDDLTSAVLRWLQHGGGNHAVLELHDGKPGGYRWQDVVETVKRLRGRAVLQLRIPVSALRLAAVTNLAVARLSGYPPMLTPGKVRELTHEDWVCDNVAISRELGWSPQVRLEEGLKRTLE